MWLEEYQERYEWSKFEGLFKSEGVRIVKEGMICGQARSLREAPICRKGGWGQRFV